MRKFSVQKPITDNMLFTFTGHFQKISLKIEPIFWVMTQSTVYTGSLIACGKTWTISVNIRFI